MSKPRKIEKGTTYLLTRRCTQRKFLLTPSAIVTQVFLYCLGYAAKKFGILVHAVCVMANHYHLVITDVHGTLPRFAHWLHEFIAKCLNIHYDREESFWAPGPYSAVELTDDNDLIAKVVYALQNPVQAGLVGTSEAWPGICSRPEDMHGTRWTVARPSLYFSPTGTMPETSEVVFCPPPNVDPESFVTTVRGLLDFTEANHRHGAARAGKRFLGAKAIRAQHPHAAPKTRPRRPREGRIRPTIACADKWRRIAKLKELAEFHAAYQQARGRWREGDREALFPHGTYLLRYTAQVRCAPPPT
jgi:putative transposase